MASVTFPEEFGGDGNTYTDDDNPNTGMGNDGHRERFVPSLANAVAMAAWTKEKASETHRDRLTATDAAARAIGAKTTAQAAASTATSAADVAQESARLAAAFYPSVTLALQETVSGQYFQIAENGYVQLYLNDAGSAKPLLKMASQESLDALNARPDPLLTSLLF